MKISTELQDKIDALKLFILSKMDSDGMIDGTNSRFNVGKMVQAVERVIYGELAINYATRNYNIRETAAELRAELHKEQVTNHIFKKGNVVINNDRAIMITEDSSHESLSFTGVLLWKSSGMTNNVGDISAQWHKQMEMIEGAGAYRLSSLIFRNA